MLLIDVYNVLWLGNASDPRGADLTPSTLLRLIASSRYRRRALRLVCDGHPPAGEGVPSPMFGDRALRLRLGPGEIVYSGHAGSADDVIERILDDHDAARDLTVVSSDNRVKRAASRRRARCIASEVFLAHLLADRTAAPLPAVPAFIQEIPLSAHAVDLWRREFGLPPETDTSLIQSLSPPALDPSTLNIPTPQPHHTRTPRSGARPSDARSRGQKPPANPPRPPDPELTRLMQEWGLAFDLDDLDMERWLRTNPSTPPRDPPH